MIRRPFFTTLTSFAIAVALLWQTSAIAQQTKTVAAPQSTAAEQQNVAELAKRLKKHVETLSKDFHSRDRFHLENQAKCVKYISEHFKKAGAVVSTQDVKYRGQTHQNVIARFGNKGGKRFIIGAHYDAVPHAPAADDNASGVAAVIELAYMLGEKAKAGELKMDFELVSYTLEEVGLIGSTMHASSLKAQKVDVAGAIAFDMIGYFSDEPNSQDYPVEAMKKKYPTKGNFIVVVGRNDQEKFVEQIGKTMESHKGVKTIYLAAPMVLPDIWRSDHASYWFFGWKGLLITDTANLRNKAYHTPQDTADRLNFEKMAHVTLGVWKVMNKLPFEEKAKSE
ncbi:MAG: M28 family peptidase [Planctomycetia bacterium]|jgi:hypothetical protein